MFNTVSSRLSAQFKTDGSHLGRYVHRSEVIRSAICEELVLHDKIFIPTNDFITACGLAFVIGENSLIDLLERNRLKFLRLRSLFGYMRGTELDGGLLCFSDPNNLRPQDSPIESSINAALNEPVVAARLRDAKKLAELIAQNSIAEETTEILPAITSEVIKDFKRTEFWLNDYEDPNPSLLRLPGMGKMEVKVIGASENPSEGPVEMLLWLAVKNMDLYLAKKYSCQSISPFHPVGDFLDIKASRAGIEEQKFSSLVEILGVPNFSSVDFNNTKLLNQFLDLTESKNARCFRQWFHSLSAIDEREVFKAYIGLLNEVPWIQRLPAKTIRFAFTTVAGLIPGIGFTASLFDAYVLETVFRGNSPKYFIDDLTRYRSRKN